MSGPILAAPDEPLVEHIRLCLREWGKLAPRLCVSLGRLFEGGKFEAAVEAMLRLHDLGKAVDRWQSAPWAVGKPAGGKPAHAFVGAAYLWKVAGDRSDAFRAAAFAIAIHHIDSSLLGASTEDPGSYAIRKGLLHEGRLRWAEGLGELEHVWSHFASTPAELTVDDLASFSLELRRWARGGSLLVLHQRRLQVAAMHSVLKVCDVRASASRQGYSESDHSRVLVSGGWLP